MKGQITTGILITLGSIIATSVVAVFGIKIQAQEQVAQVSERVAKLETSIPQIQVDIQEIKQSTKETSKNILELIKTMK